MNRGPAWWFPLHWTFDADLSSQYEYHFPRHDLWSHFCRGGAVLGSGRDSTVTICNLCWSSQAAAGSLQSSAPRGRPWDWLPLLPYLGGDLKLCWHSSNQNLHELPFADLDQCAVARTSAREL